MILIAFFVAACAADRFQFALDMPFTWAYDPTSQGLTLHGKATSQIMTTAINANDAVKFTVKAVPGNYAELIGTALQQQLVANVSFGTHLFRSHSVAFSGGYSLDSFEQGSGNNGTYFFSGTAAIGGGVGQFVGAQGSVALSGSADIPDLSNPSTGTGELIVSVFGFV